MKKIRLFLTVLSLILAASIYAQEIQVSGTVTDAETGQEVPFASIQIKGTSAGATADELGKYSVGIPADGVLIFSFIGYQTKQVDVNKRQIIDVVMSPDVANLDEVLVIAYGTAKKESFTGSAEVITSAELENRTVSNISKALDGLATGVVSLGGSGQPGAGSNIVIRGFGSLNASNNPLYVVDGVPYEGNINALNTNDIESMTIIKDASAGALYGARGANGVIIITTKKGKEGSLRVNVKANWGFASRAVPRYETMNSSQWVEDLFISSRHPYLAEGLSVEAAGDKALEFMSSGPLGIFGKDEEYNPFTEKIKDLIDVSTGKIVEGATLKWNEDWLEEATESAPLRQEYLISVNGGDAKTKYMFSLGYLGQEGLVLGTDFNRFTGRVNVDSKITKWLKGGLSINLASNKSNSTTLGAENTSNTAYSNVFYSSQNMAPIYPVYLKSKAGNTVYDKNGDPEYDWGKNRPAGANAGWHPIANLEEDKFIQVSDNLSGRTYVDFLDMETGPIKGLKISTNFGFDYINNKETTYFNPNFGNAVSTNGRLVEEIGRTLSYTFNQLVTYKRKFGKHDIDFLVGHEFFNRGYDYLGGSKTGVVFDGLYELDGFGTIAGLDGYSTDYAVDSYLGRINYGYNDKYYVSGSYRRDASSRFHSDNRWGDFWSVGASWRISEETFLKNINWINNLTLKASYGVQGNDNIGPYYAWQQLYSLGYNNSSFGGVIVSTLETKDLKWEKNNNLNVGIESRIFDRLSITAEYYNKVTNDMLMTFPIAFSLGFDGYNANVGSMLNSGFEMSISADIIKNDKLYWNMNLMGSTVNNKILKLTGQNSEIIDGNFIQKEGESINSFYLAKSAGVDPKTGDKLYYTWTNDPNTGERVYETTNNHAVAANYREVAGSRIPVLYGSWANNLRLANFDLSILTTYSIGGKLLDEVYYGYLYNQYPGVTGHIDRQQAWQKPGDITSIPRIDNGGRTKTTYTEDDLTGASYFTLKNVTFGYTFPAKWTQKASIQALRLYMSGDNLWIKSARKGLDPQFNFSGSTGYAYTPERTISFGIDITF